MVGCVGSDAFGASARANLDRNGVQTDLVVIGEESTGCAFITVDQHGENAITVASGANAIVTGTIVPASRLDALTLAVFQMEVPFAASLEVAQRVQEAGGRVVWNFAPAPPAFRAEDLSKLLGTTDVFIVNEHEAIAAAEVLGHTTTDFEQAGAVLSQASQGICVVTAGAGDREGRADCSGGYDGRRGYVRRHPGKRPGRGSFVRPGFGEGGSRSLHGLPYPRCANRNAEASRTRLGQKRS
jgi:ribokinase